MDDLLQDQTVQFLANVASNNMNLNMLSNNENPVSIPNFQNQFDHPNPNPILLALVNPQYTQRNESLFYQIRMITAEVLRATNNDAFHGLKREIRCLQKELEHLRRWNSELQTSVLRVYANGLPSSSSPPEAPPRSNVNAPNITETKPAEEAKTVTKREKPDDCLVDWWKKPASTDRTPFKIVKSRANSSDSDDESHSDSEDTRSKRSDDKSSRCGVYGWMQENDGSLIEFDEKDRVYKDHHSFWNDMEHSHAPENYSTLKHAQIDAFIKFIEPLHPWLSLCDGHWKARELLKCNYKSWRRTWQRRKNKEKKDKAEKKKERREWQEEKNESRVPSEAKEVSVVTKKGLALIEISDDESDEEATPVTASNVPSSSKGKERATEPKAVSNGKLSSKKLKDLNIQFKPINVGKLADKAASCLNPALAVPTAANGQPLRHNPIPIVEKFAAKVNGLPKSIPTAKKGDAFTGYANEPATYTTDITKDDLWPKFDGPITALIPVGDDDTRRHLVVRGKYGLPAFLKFIQHLAYDCQMDTAVLEPKLERLMQTIDVVVAAPTEAPSEPKPAKTKKRKNTNNDGPLKPKKSKSSGSWKIPNLICPKWLYAADWKQTPGNEDLSMSAFDDAWTALEKDKEKLKLYQELAREKNTEAAAAKTGKSQVTSA
ncbi:hypothetical protein AAF712_013767 [Marasmius tenuissimus]|uniref:Uncharacterized protein n=1 Tax=Marasmius tenuissimus TaxID=585030 RepID=A0ABR2ZCU8_9AGAR